MGCSPGVPVLQMPPMFWWKAPLKPSCEQKVRVASKVPSLLNANQAHSPPRPTTLVQNGCVFASQLSDTATWNCAVLPYAPADDAAIDAAANATTAATMRTRDFRISALP